MKGDNITVIISVFLVTFFEWLEQILVINAIDIVAISLRGVIGGIVQFMISRYFLKHAIRKGNDIVFKETYILKAEIQTLRDNFLYLENEIKAIREEKLRKKAKKALKKALKKAQQEKTKPTE